jgi:hypothetical protein
MTAGLLDTSVFIARETGRPLEPRPCRTSPASVP